MILTRQAIKKIKEKRLGLLIAHALKCSEQWINRVIKANRNNGPLTTAAALAVIREETGLKDSQILEEEKKTVTVD